MSFPEWAAPGKTVAMTYGGYRSTNVTFVKIERHTKTRVVLEDGRQFVEGKHAKGSLTEWGGSQFNTAHLRDPDSPFIKSKIAAGNERVAWEEVKKAVAAYGADRENDELHGAIYSAMTVHSKQLEEYRALKSQA